MYTLYGRAAFEGGDVSLPLMPSTGPGRDDWLVEYTFGRDGARELAFRHGDMSDGGKRLTETVLRLDLRDPANRAAAQPLLGLDWPWPRSAKERVAAVLARIKTDGTVETSVSEVADDTAGVCRLDRERDEVRRQRQADQGPQDPGLGDRADRRAVRA